MQLHFPKSQHFPRRLPVLILPATPFPEGKSLSWGFAPAAQRFPFALSKNLDLEDDGGEMARVRINFKSGTPMGIGAKLWVSLFLLVFLGLGAFFFWLIAQDAFTEIQAWTWPQTNCTIIASSVGEKPQNGRKIGDFQPEVKYRYAFGGQSFTANQYAPSDESFPDYGEAARLAEQYPAGANVLCYVNPAAPTQAVLVRYNFLRLFALLLPLVFVAVGGGGIYFIWRRKSTAPSISDRMRARGNSPRGLALFFLVFLLVGSGFFYGVVLRPLFKIIQARDWTAVPCVVLTSEVERHSGSGGGRHGSHGPTYSVNILYGYEFRGREHKANGYDFLGGSSSGYDGKEAVVDRFSPGTKTVCYVNPADPTEAVLERGFGPWMLFGVIPLVFMLIGGGGLLAIVRHRPWNTLSPAEIARTPLADPKLFE